MSNLLVEVIAAQTSRKKVVVPESVKTNFLKVVLLLGVPTERCDFQVLCCLKAELPQRQKAPINVFELVRLIFPKPEDKNSHLVIVI